MEKKWIELTSQYSRDNILSLAKIRGNLEKKLSGAIIFLDIFQALLLNVANLITFNHLFEKGG